MAKLIHIAFLTPEYSRDKIPEGGLGNYIRKAGLKLCLLGHQVSVFCLSKANSQWQDHGIQVNEVKQFLVPYQLRRLKRLSFCLPAFAQVRSARRLHKALFRTHRQNPVDIIQASNFRAPGYTLLQNSQIPVVCRLSSYTPLWRSACGRRRSVADSLCDWLEVRQVLDAQAAFAPSEFLARAFARLEGCHPSVVRTPTELESTCLDFSFYERHLQGAEYLLYFGALNGVKGVDLLLPLLSRILPKYPQLRFVFIGRDEGLPDGRKFVQALKNTQEQYPKRVLYHPSIGKMQLYPVIQGSLGVVMPSRVDNYPNACLEALAMGVPVVGTYDSSLEEMIIEGETGFLARNGDWLSLQAAVDRLLDKSESGRAEMRDRILAHVARAKAEDRVGQLLEFYHAAIANWSRQGGDRRCGIVR